MDFPVIDLMDEAACYRFLLGLLHPGGLGCPRCGRADGLGVQARHRDPVLDYRCRHCGRVFNAYTGTALERTRRPPAQWVLILRGVAQGTPTARLAREVGCDRMHLLALRHRVQGLAAAAAAAAGPGGGPQAEADEMFQNAGEKRHPASRPGRPAAPAREQAPRARHVRRRPAAGPRGPRPTDRGGRPAGGRPDGRPHPAGVRHRPHG
jgi:transposase-like protein